MYKENNPKKKNIKALFLLMILTGFGFVVFKFTKVNEILADATEETEATSCPSDVVDNSYESDETFLYLDDSGNLTDVTPDVLGTTSSGECKIGANSYFGESACSLESDIHSSFDLAGWIDDDANITLTKITAPIRLLSGIFSVKDSNGDITKENPYYPPSGGIIKAKLVEIKTAPGEIHEEVVDETINNAVRKQAYSAQYTLTVADQPDDATLTINQYSSNDCGEACDNEANNNPDRSNKSSNF
jgi:hypothetical protein